MKKIEIYAVSDAEFDYADRALRQLPHINELCEFNPALKMDRPNPEEWIGYEEMVLFSRVFGRSRMYEFNQRWHDYYCDNVPVESILKLNLDRPTLVAYHDRFYLYEGMR